MRFRPQALLEKLARFPVVAAVVSLDAGRRGPSRRRDRDPHRGGCGDAAAALAHHRLQHEQRDRRGERPLVALDRAARRVHGNIRLGHFPDAVGRQQTRGVVVERRVEPTGRLGDLRHARRVEPGLDDFSRRVPHEVARAERDFRALGRPHADRENADAVGRGLLGGGEAVGIEFLAVGDDDQRPRKPLGFAEGFGGLADGGGDVGAAFGDELRVEFVEGGEHRAVVEGERRLQKRRAGEGDEADAVRAEFAHEIFGEQLGALEPRWGHVGREHRARDVHGDDHIAAAVRHFERVVAEARAGEDDHDQPQRAQHARAAEPPARRAGVAREQGAQLRGDDAADHSAAAPLGPPEEGREQRQQPQGVESARMRETQGRRLHSVCPSNVSATSSTAPAATNQWNRSRYCATFCTSTRDFSSSSISAKIRCKVCVSVARK